MPTQVVIGAVPVSDLQRLDYICCVFYFYIFCMKKTLLCCWFYFLIENSKFFCTSLDFQPQTITMVNHNPAHVALMVFGFLVFLAAITFNFLSGFGAKSGQY